MCPLISIIIPTFNRGAVIRETLQSVEKQTYDNWECIVIDDGSMDDTKSIVNSFAENKFKYYYIEHGGRSRARNFGLSMSRGDFIQFLDSDDLLEEPKLEISLDLLQKQQAGRKICITDFTTFLDSPDDPSGPYCKLEERFFNYKDVLFKWGFEFSIPIHSGLFDRQLLKDFRFPENLSQWEDWFLWLHVFQQPGLETIFIQRPLALCRVPRNKTMLDYREEKLVEEAVLLTLQKRIPDDDRAEYYFQRIKKKNNRLNEVQNSISNLKKTKTYRLSEKIKNIMLQKKRS